MWGDEKFRMLPKAHRLSWIYLLTGPESNQVGLYRLSADKMADDLSERTASVRRSIDLLKIKGMVLYDEGSSLLWIPNWLVYNAPEGSNQAKGYLNAAKEFLPHKFAVALRFIILAYIQDIPGCGLGILNKKQAIIIRDNGRCAYCEKAIESWEDLEIDHVIPESREAGNGKYDDLVTACIACNREKGNRTAEEFGFPFVRGATYSIGAALKKLITDTDLRARFNVICRGLPAELDGIEQVSELILERRCDVVATPFERRDCTVRTQEQRTGTENRNRDQEVPPKAPHGEGGGQTTVRKRKSGMRIDQVPSDAIKRFDANVWPNVRARSGAPKKKQDALLVYAQIDPAEWRDVEIAVTKYYSDKEFTEGDGKPVDLVRFLETGKGVETWREWVTVEPVLSPGERMKQAKGCDVCEQKGFATIENTTYRCRCDKGAVMWGGKGGQLTEAEYAQLTEDLVGK